MNRNLNGPYPQSSSSTSSSSSSSSSNGTGSNETGNSKAAAMSLQRLAKEGSALLTAASKGWDLRGIMRTHAFCSIALGSTTVCLPHSYLGAGYSHYAHEFIRLYGCLTLSIGWIVWKSQSIRDGRLARAFSETFALAYTTQCLVMLRAQFTNPDGHTLLHWLVALAFGALGLLYGYVRYIKKIRNFALPLAGEDD